MVPRKKLMGDEKRSTFSDIMVVITVFVVVVFAVFAVCIMPLAVTRVYRRVMNDAEAVIVADLLQEFEVVDGIIQSPSVIIILDDSVDTFIEKGLELGADTIYRFEDDYYVFNYDKSMAWRYSIDIADAGFMGLGMRWGNP